MAKILFIGGSGEISLACVTQATRANHNVTVFNRGNRASRIAGVRSVVGDVRDTDTLGSLAREHFDVVCQFLAFSEQDVLRDIELFTGRCEHYLYISSASAYLKPWYEGRITEDTPLRNPFMAYSRDKAAGELALTAATDSFPATIVRPSHTYRTRLPSVIIDGDHLLWRLLNNKPILVHDNGETLWTLTHATDFAKALTSLFTQSASIGEAFHITDCRAHTWRSILEATAGLLATDMTLYTAPSSAIAEYHDAWRGPLLGDKANNLVFDTNKIEAITGGWRCEISLVEGLKDALALARERHDAGYQPPARLDALLDNAIAEIAKPMTA